MSVASEGYPAVALPESEVERQAEAAALADDMNRAGLLPNPPTDVEFVRYVSPEEQQTFRHELMRERAIGTLTGRRRQLLAAEITYRVAVMYPLHPRYHQPLNGKQLRMLFNYYVGVLIPCLEAQGHDVGAVPSWEFFRQSPEHLRWDPYARLNPVWSRMSRSDFDRLQTLCPARPPDADLYPGVATPEAE